MVDKACMEKARVNDLLELLHGLTAKNAECHLSHDDGTIPPAQHTKGLSVN